MLACYIFTYVMSFVQRYRLHNMTYSLSICLLKLSTDLFRRSEEKDLSCELRYCFVNYVIVLSNSTMNTGNVAVNIRYRQQTHTFLT